MNTNNEQAKAEQRAPLKSNEELFAVWKRIADMPGHFILEAVHQELHLLRDFYEATITSGELRVAKTARMEKMQAKSYLDPYYKCSECGHEWMDYVPEVGEFCKCGAKIIE